MLSLIFSAVAFADTPPPVYNFTSPLTKTGTTVTCQSVGSAQAGCVPASGGGTTNFLRADGTWSAPSSVSTGSANTVSYFNSSGALTSSVNYRLNDANGWLVFSTIGAGATTANVGLFGGAGLLVGNVAGTSSILSGAYGVGQIVFGDSLSNAQISVQGNGSIVGGYGTNSGIIATELDGGGAFGRADTSGQVSSNGIASLVWGYADNSSIAGASGGGSNTFGWSTGGSTLATTAGKYGQHAGGLSSGGGDIVAGGNGASVDCYADSGGVCSASGDGSFVHARSHGAGSAVASGIGSVSLGEAYGFSLTSSGNGSLTGGAPATASTTASGLGAIAWGDGDTSSGTMSTTFGLGNINNSYAAMVIGKYANLSGSTASSWVSTDPLLVLGNGSSGSPANAFSVLKNGAVTGGAFSGTTFSGTAFSGTSFAGTILANSGILSAPGISFSAETNSGLFRVGAGELGLAILGAQALDIQKSTSGYGNLGMGGPASLSDSYPLLIQRDVVSAGVYGQVANVDTAAYSKATWQLTADAGNNFGELSLFTSATPLSAYANSMTVRPSGNTKFLSLIGGDLSSGYVSTFTGGDYTATGETMRFNADHSAQFMQEIATPAAPAAGSDKIYAKSDHNIYHETPAGTELKLLDSSYTPPASVPTLVLIATGNTTLTTTNLNVLVNSSSSVTITLPDAVANANYSWMIKNIGTGLVTIVGTSGQLIDGASSGTMTQYNAASFLAANGGYNVW